VIGSDDIEAFIAEPEAEPIADLVDEAAAGDDAPYTAIKKRLSDNLYPKVNLNGTFDSRDTALQYLLSQLSKPENQPELKKSIWNNLNCVHVDGLKVIAQFRNTNKLRDINHLRPSLMSNLLDKNPEEHAMIITDHLINSISKNVNINKKTIALSTTESDSSSDSSSEDDTPLPKNQPSKKAVDKDKDKDDDMDMDMGKINKFAGLAPKKAMPVQNDDDDDNSLADDNLDDVPLSQRELPINQWHTIATQYSYPNNEKWIEMLGLTVDQKQALKLRVFKRFETRHKLPRKTITDLSCAPTCKLACKGKKNERYSHDLGMKLTINYSLNTQNPGNEGRVNFACSKNRFDPPGQHKTYMWFDLLLTKYEKGLDDAEVLQ
jgi:hypothetical protein